ncbi:hypothetical protein GCM10023321_45250 [Pseudonocardia eucalypti]|uniref:Cupin type-2 domain-containing protein n=1 Tax=Pseudonocardia eucalypti TaxID=648755 RepID=A0ABP9QG85_9PSEU|nr:quercetin dioxygenase-like cupin family protein [Pseudonocardia eucalypti]
MSRVRHWRSAPGPSRGGLTVHAVHEDPATGLRQSVYRLTGEAELAGPGVDRLETLYVLSGRGTLTAGGTDHPLNAQVAALRLGEEPCAVSAAEELVIVSVAASERAGVACGPRRPTIDLAGQVAEDAVSEREFRMLFGPETGCSGVTQFVGYVPPIRTPRHFHPYSEMIFVLAGRGEVEIDGEVSAIGPGCCFYLPAGLPHQVANLGDGFLELLGVFTPAGSPAENSPA